jgi:hypothetical protein
MQPDQRCVGMRDHEWQRMSDPTCPQARTTTPEAEARGTYGPQGPTKDSLPRRTSL